MKYYIVGGAVRDMLMGRLAHEVDLAFEGSVEEFLRAEPFARQVGKSVRVCILNGNEYMPLYGGQITADLFHRDLTINALALDENGLLYTHPQSLLDLKQGILRPTTAEAFFEDPLRIYRLARFAATFSHFSVHTSALEQARAVIAAGKHRCIPAERVGREFLKALQAASPSRFMEVLQKLQALSPIYTHWFSELASLSEDELSRLGKLLDDFKPEYTMSHKADTKLKHKNSLSLGRFMLMAYSLRHAHNAQNSTFICNDIYGLTQRLSLPKQYAKIATHFADTAPWAQNLMQLEHGKIIKLLLNTHKLGISFIYWQCLKHCSGHDLTHQASALLNVILTVRLPKEWQNRGKNSEEKLHALRCAAIKKYLEKAAIAQVIPIVRVCTHE